MYVCKPDPAVSLTGSGLISQASQKDLFYSPGSVGLPHAEADPRWLVNTISEASQV